jgi:microcystin-dependent protein
MTRREYAGAAAATTLAGALSPTGLTLNLDAATGWPDGSVGPFAIVIDRGTASEEKVLVASRTTTSLTVSVLGNRGYDDTTAIAHDAGATVEVCLTAVDLDEANQHINDTGLDHHTQYHNAARHAAVSHTTAMIGDGQVTSAKLVTAQRLEAGDLKWSARTSPSSGWLLCDGTAYNRTTYADLFAAIGTTFGAGDGTTTFNVPDFRGRALVAAGAGTGLTTRSRGQTFGAESVADHTHTGPAHTHAVSGNTGNNSTNHTHGFFDAGGGTGEQVDATEGQSVDHTHPVSLTSGSSGTGATGAGGAITGLIPAAVANCFIKT